MKKLTVLFVAAALLAAGAALGADPMGGGHMGMGAFHGSAGEAQALDALRDALAANRDTEIGSITLGQLERIVGRIWTARLRAAYIEHSRRASFRLPGMGQFMNGDPLSGSLFLSADVALTVGALVGAYFVLPADLRFDRLNYFTAPWATIEERWKSHSFVDGLPALGVLAGGAAVKLGLRFLSAAHAGRLARDNLDSGKVTLAPWMLMGWGRRGFGMGMHMRY